MSGKEATTHRTSDWPWDVPLGLVGHRLGYPIAVAFAASLPPTPGYAMLETRRLLDASNLRNQLQLESVAISTAARGEFFKAALRKFRESHPG